MFHNVGVCLSAGANFCQHQVSLFVSYDKQSTVVSVKDGLCSPVIYKFTFAGCYIPATLIRPYLRPRAPAIGHG